MNTGKYWIISGGAALLAAAAFFWMQPAQRVSPSDPASATSAAPTSAARQAQQEVTTKQPNEGSHAERGAVALNKALLDAKDLRVFVEMAKQRPEDGGLYFAKAVNNYCSDARRFLASPEQRDVQPGETHKTTIRRDAATDRLRRLCGGFLESEADGTGYVALVKHPSANLDPLIASEKKVLSDTSDPSLKEKMREQATLNFLNTPVPLVIVNAPLSEVNSNGAFFFDGKTYGGKGDFAGGSLLQAARFLAACKFGDDCGESDRYLLLPCATEGICTSSRSEYVAALFAKDLGSEHANRYQEAVQLSEKMARAIQDKNVAAFIKPR